MPRITTATLLALCLAGCAQSTGNPDPDAFVTNDNLDRNAVLANIATSVVLPALSDFEAATADLTSATIDLRDAIQGGAADVATRQTLAQRAFEDAMAVWQQLEVLQFGPTGPSASVVGGEDLRDPIYSYPIVNACRVDQELVEGRFVNDPSFTSTELVNVLGLDALRQLLFDTDTTNGCSSAADINANGSWNALVASGDLPLRRAQYAAVLALELNLRATELRARWEASGGDFARQLAEAGQGPGAYSSAQQALNDVYFGLFYIELITKDLKLGLPLGVTSAGGAQPDAVESTFANNSKENILVNLRTFQRVFLGERPGEPDAPGFDKLLQDLGASALAQELTSDTAAAIAAVEAIPGDLRSAITSDPQIVRAAFDATKALADDLKGQLPTVLNLRVPAQGAGDND